MTSKRELKQRLDEFDSGDGKNLPGISLAQLLSSSDSELEPLPGNRVRLHGRVYRIPHVFYDILSPEGDE